jgi:hypothetical protein
VFVYSFATRFATDGNACRAAFEIPSGSNFSACASTAPPHPRLPMRSRPEKIPPAPE